MINRTVLFLWLCIMATVWLIGCNRSGDMNPQPVDPSLPLLTELSVQRNALYAGGDTTLVTARALSINGIPVRTTIYFASKRGTLPDSVNTDTTGFARVVYFTSTTAITDTITARVGFSSRNITVGVFAQTSGLLAITATPLHPNATGNDTVTVTGFIATGDSNNVTASFSSTAGTWVGFPGSVAPISGQVQAKLIFPGSVSDTTITATIQLNGMSTGITQRSVLITASGVRLQPFPGNVRQVVGDGTTQYPFQASVSNNLLEPIARQEVRMTSQLGTVGGLAMTDSFGIANYNYRPPLLDNGTDTVRLRLPSGAVTAQQIVAIQNTGTTPSNIAFIGASRTQIGVRGSGSPETAELTFEVRDAQGRPIRQPEPVTFSYQGSIPVRLDPTSANTGNDGRVRVTVNSDTVAGTIRIIARVPLYGIESQAIAVAIHGGPPDQTHFATAANRGNLPGWICVLDDTISAFVGDRYANPVPPNTTVYFTTDGGFVQGSAQTDSMGTAKVNLLTSLPHPPSGIATIQARTLNGSGDTIRATSSVIFSAASQMIVTPSTGTLLAYGSSQSFDIDFGDLNGNPPVAGSTITVRGYQLNGSGEWVTGEGFSLVGPGTGEEPYRISGGESPARITVIAHHAVSGLQSHAARIEATLASDAPCQGNGGAFATASLTLQPQQVSTAITYSSVTVNPQRAIANGNAQITVNIVLRDILGNFISNVLPGDVVISTTRGFANITQPSTPTDPSGRTSGTLTSTVLGADTILVTIQPAGQNVQLLSRPAVRFTAGPAATLFLNASRTSLTVGGDTTRITATLYDASGNLVEDGTMVSFSTDRGNFQQAVAMTTNGAAHVTLLSAEQVGTAVITGTSGNANGQLQVTFVAGAAAQISVSANPDTIATSGSSRIEASVTDRFGNPSYNQTIRFDLPTNPLNGMIVTPLVNSNSLGIAASTYVAGTTSGTARVRVAVAADTTISAQTSVWITGSSTTGTVLRLSAAPTMIFANDSSMVSATLTTNSQPVVNRFIRFEVVNANGTVAPDSSLTNSSGVAQSRYLNAGLRGAARIVARVSVFGDTTVYRDSVWIQIQ